MDGRTDFSEPWKLYTANVLLTRYMLYKAMEKHGLHHRCWREFTPAIEMIKPQAVQSSNGYPVGLPPMDVHQKRKEMNDFGNKRLYYRSATWASGAEI